MAEKIYAGKGKKKNDTWIQASLDIETLNKYIEEFKGKKFVKVNINIGSPDKFGKDVQITIDTWRPTKQQNTQPITEPLDDLPF